MRNESTLNQCDVTERDQEYDLAAEAGQRANMYELLATCFLQEPTIKMLTSIKNALCYLEGDFSSESFPKREVQASPETIKQCYYDRFFVPFSGKYVPPIESSIRGGDPGNRKQPFGPLDVAASINVSSCYETAGFNPYTLIMCEPLKGLQFMDHFGFEMAFMAYLSYAEEATWKINDSDKAKQWRRLQHQFLSEHLSKWCHRYAEELTLRGSDIYSDIAKISAQWIENDSISFNAEEILGVQ